MKAYDEFIAWKSEYYVYTPSAVAQRLFFYPICIGRFVYKPGYSLYRDSYDSYLLLYVQSGEITVHCGEKKEKATAGEFILIDCYKPHGYYTDAGCDALWCHYDGPLAREYFEVIISRMGHVFALVDSYQVIKKMNTLFQMFAEKQALREPLLSKHLTDIFTFMLLDSSRKTTDLVETGKIQEMVVYINEHITEDLSVQRLAKIAMFSPYHFIRIFKKETGFTPHEYIVHVRINMAKFLLKNTKASVKDICYNTGFSSESSFCVAFKKKTGRTPAEYRNRIYLEC